jgi:hypothetical protein
MFSLFYTLYSSPEHKFKSSQFCCVFTILQVAGSDGRFASYTSASSTTTRHSLKRLSPRLAAVSHEPSPLLEVEAEAEVKLPLTVSRPVCLDVGLPSGAHDQIFVFCLMIAGFLIW